MPGNGSGHGDLRTRLHAALAQPDARARMDRLAALAQEPLGLVETIQLDKALTRADLPSDDRYSVLRVALLSTHTVEHLLPAIRVAGLAHGVRFAVHAGAFGQYRRELLDADSPLHGTPPELVVLSLHADEMISGVPLAASAADVDEHLGREIAELRGLWRRAREDFHATVIQQTFLDVSLPLFGSHDRRVPAAPSRLVARLNDLLAEAAAQDGTLLLDLAQASARDGIDAWFDVARWLQAKMEIAPQAARRYGELLARVAAAHLGRSRKCLVLDLDNTLWGGVVGDVGTAGLALGQGSAQGEAHLALQRYALRLKERGVILAVCSKNDPALAQAAFRDHPEMLLRPDDIAAFVANWNDKAQNLEDVARRLNIGLDSLVFVDDNPVERARVREALPMVAVPELPADPALFARCLADEGYFESVGLTDADRQRGEQYAANASRESAMHASASLEDFLRGLQMSLSYGTVTTVDLPRAAQLINKTNQFNTTARRYPPDEVARLAAAPENVVLQFRLADRFGDNGLVSVMILRSAPDRPRTLDIDTWVMSCRVFGRQLEHEAMTIAVETARARGVRTLRARHVPTERNGVVARLFPDLGFEALAPDPQGGTASRWTVEVDQYVARQTFISRKANG